MVIDPVSTREVQTALKKLKSNKTADCMDITCEHLTFGCTPVILFLTDIINYIFECKQVLSVLTVGLVTPILKKGDRSDPANYHGITVTTVLLKVIEHVLRTQRHIGCISVAFAERIHLRTSI